MAVIDVLNDKAEKISQVELPDAIFDVPVKRSVLHEVVTMQLARQTRGLGVGQSTGAMSREAAASCFARRVRAVRVEATSRRRCFGAVVSFSAPSPSPGPSGSPKRFGNWP